MVLDVGKRGRSNQSDCCTEKSIHATAQSCFCHFQATTLPSQETWHGCAACRSNPLLDLSNPCLLLGMQESLVRAAVQSARCDPSWDNADQALAEAYRASANLWEAEIRRIAGAHTTTRKGSLRGTFPRMVWRPLLKQTKRELAASCVPARSLEWALSRLVEARHWAQYAVRRGATASSVTKFSAAISSFRQGHQVTEDCRSEDLTMLREEGLLLLDRLKQITLAWVSLWKNVASGQGEEEHFQQTEEAQLEEAGMQVSAELDEWEVTARECIDMALKQNAIETRARWSEWVISALEGGARRAHA